MPNKYVCSSVSGLKNNINSVCNPICCFSQLKYWKDGTNEQDSVYYLSRRQRPWAIVVGLQPDTLYYVKVMAYNSAGEGPESERFLGK